MTDALRALCALTGEVLFGGQEYADREGWDWEEIHALSQKQSVASTVVYAVTGGIPKALQREWIGEACQTERKNYLVYQGNFLIHRLLQANHIPYVILKGMASSQYYREDYFRIQGDVDFLVPPELAEKTKELLRKNGFQELDSLDYEIEYEKNGVSYELHTAVNGIPEGAKGQRIRELLQNLIDTAVPLQGAEGTVMVPDEFHHGLVLLLHTAKHLVSFGIGLRQISDWAVFADSVGERFPEVFEKALRECGLWTFAQALTEACVRYLHREPLSWTGCFEDAFLERFMDDLLRKGGLHHDEDDDMDALLVEKTDEGGASDAPMLIQLLKNIGKKAQFRWPFMKKMKILVPFGMTIMCTQYAFGMMSGKYKKIKPKAMKAKAEQRRTLYRELALFE